MCIEARVDALAAADDEQISERGKGEVERAERRERGGGEEGIETGPRISRSGRLLERGSDIGVDCAYLCV